MTSYLTRTCICISHLQSSLDVDKKGRLDSCLNSFYLPLGQHYAKGTDLDSLFPNVKVIILKSAPTHFQERITVEASLSKLCQNRPYQDSNLEYSDR